MKMGRSQHIVEEDELPERVRATMERMPWCQSTIALSTTDEKYDSEVSEQPRYRRKPLKSGKLCTANSMVLTKVTWPHELVYTALG